EASKYLRRPMTIGRLSARVRPGSFLLEDVVIEGRTPESRPFLRAERISVELPWWTIFRGELLFEEIRMTGWDLYIESFADGSHNMPRMMPDRRPSGPKRFVTTLRSVVAEQGQFSYDDHGTPWSIVARNMVVSVGRAGGEYRGAAQFQQGTIDIQDYVPMRADLRSRFTFDGPRIRFDDILLLTDGAESRLTGQPAFSNWPVQTYEIASTPQCPRIRALSVANESGELSGASRFNGVCHMFRGGRDLSGDFESSEVGVNDYRFGNVAGHV